jgi:hypothetical protein
VDAQIGDIYTNNGDEEAQNGAVRVSKTVVSDSHHFDEE